MARSCRLYTAFRRSNAHRCGNGNLTVIDVLSATLAQKKPKRSEKLEALKRESELALRDLIRRLLAKPPGERTHFLRKRIGIGSTCL